MADLPLPPGARVVAYLRDSGGADQDTSIEQQRQAVAEWCRASGLALTRVFADAARSGTTTAGRTEFAAMIEHFYGDPQEVGVVLWEYARLARNYDDFMFYVADLRRRGYIIHSLHDTVPAGLDGRLLESITAWKNARYSEDLSRASRRGLHYVVEHHRAWTGPRPPVGYRYAPAVIGVRRDGSPHTITRLEIDPPAAERVHRAFEMRSHRRTYREIHAETQLFTGLSNYYKLFRNRIYIGIRDLAGRAYLGFCEPIIEPPLWDAVQQINAQTATGADYTHPRRAGSRFLLSGLAICAGCGKRLSGHSNPDKYKLYRYYRCNRSRPDRDKICDRLMIPADELERLVVQAVAGHLRKPQIIADAYAELRRQAEARAAIDPSIYDTQLTALAREIANVLAAVRAAGHSPALLAELAALERRQAETRAARDELELRRAAQAPPDLTEAQLAALSERLAEQLETADRRTVQLLLRQIVVRVEAERVDGVVRGEIEMYVLPDGGDATVTVSLVG